MKLSCTKCRKTILHLSGQKLPTPIADSMDDTTTNLVDHIPEVNPVIQDAINLPISAFDLASASSLDTEVPDHEKEQEVIMMENNKDNSNVPIEVAETDETKIGTRRSSRLPCYPEKYLAYRQSLGLQAVSFAMPTNFEDTKVFPLNQPAM